MLLIPDRTVFSLPIRETLIFVLRKSQYSGRVQNKIVNVQRSIKLFVKTSKQTLSSQFLIDVILKYKAVAFMLIKFVKSYSRHVNIHNHVYYRNRILR